MKLHYLLSIIFMAFTIALTSCQEDGGKSVESVVSPDLDQLIRNPISMSGQIDSSSLAVLSFEKDVIYFDTVAMGTIVEEVFRFTNTGTGPLWLSNARSTCGCTVPDYPKDPIPPGEGGEITVRFNTSDRGQYQDRPVTIYANTIPGRTVVRLRGFVTEASPES